MFFLDELPTQEMLDSYSARYSQMQPDKLYKVLCFLRKASCLMRDLDSFFSEHGLSQTRFYILILLDREPVKGQLTSIDLSRKLNISKAVTSTNDQRFERQRIHYRKTAPHRYSGKGVSAYGQSRRKVTSCITALLRVNQRR